MFMKFSDHRAKGVVRKEGFSRIKPRQDEDIILSKRKDRLHSQSEPNLTHQNNFDSNTLHDFESLLESAGIGDSRKVETLSKSYSILPSSRSSRTPSRSDCDRGGVESSQISNSVIFRENNADETFNRLIRKVKKLWFEIKMPPQDIHFYACNLLEGPSKSIDDCRNLSRYVKLLQNHRRKTLEVLNAIDMRESAVRKCFDVLAAIHRCMKYKHRMPVNEIDDISLRYHENLIWQEELVTSLAEVQSCTVDVIKRIQLWRKDLWRPQAFVWNRANYLFKITTDMNVLDTEMYCRQLEAIPLYREDLVGILFDNEDGENHTGLHSLASDVSQKEDMQAHPRSAGIDNGAAGDGQIWQVESSALRDLFLRLGPHTRELALAAKVAAEEEMLQQAVKKETAVLVEMGVFIPTLKFDVATTNPASKSSSSSIGARRRREGGNHGDQHGVAGGELGTGPQREAASIVTFTSISTPPNDHDHGDVDFPAVIDASKHAPSPSHSPHQLLKDTFTTPLETPAISSSNEALHPPSDQYRTDAAPSFHHSQPQQTPGTIPVGAWDEIGIVADTRSSPTPSKRLVVPSSISPTVDTPTVDTQISAAASQLLSPPLRSVPISTADTATHSPRVAVPSPLPDGDLDRSECNFDAPHPSHIPDPSHMSRGQGLEAASMATLSKNEEELFEAIICDLETEQAARTQLEANLTAFASHFEEQSQVLEDVLQKEAADRVRMQQETNAISSKLEMISSAISQLVSDASGQRERMTLLEEQLQSDRNRQGESRQVAASLAEKMETQHRRLEQQIGEMVSALKADKSSSAKMVKAWRQASSKHEDALQALRKELEREKKERVGHMNKFKELLVAQDVARKALNCEVDDLKEVKVSQRSELEASALADESTQRRQQCDQILELINAEKVERRGQLEAMESQSRAHHLQVLQLMERLEGERVARENLHDQAVANAEQWERKLNQMFTDISSSGNIERLSLRDQMSGLATSYETRLDEFMNQINASSAASADESKAILTEATNQTVQKLASEVRDEKASIHLALEASKAHFDERLQSIERELATQRTGPSLQATKEIGPQFEEQLHLLATQVAGERGERAGLHSQMTKTFSQFEDRISELVTEVRSLHVLGTTAMTSQSTSPSLDPLKDILAPRQDQSSPVALSSLRSPLTSPRIPLFMATPSDDRQRPIMVASAGIMNGISYNSNEVSFVVDEQPHLLPDERVATIGRGMTWSPSREESLPGVEEKEELLDIRNFDYSKIISETETILRSAAFPTCKSLLEQARGFLSKTTVATGTSVSSDLGNDSNTFHQMCVMVAEGEYELAVADYDGALATFGRVLAMYAPWSRAQGEQIEWGSDLIDIKATLGHASVLFHKAKFDDAEFYFTQVICSIEDTFEFPLAGEVANIYTRALVGLGHVYIELGSVNMCEKSIAKAVESGAAGPAAHDELRGDLLHLRCLVAHTKGAYDEAAELQAEALRLRLSALGSGHPKVLEARAHSALIDVARSQLPRAASNLQGLRRDTAAADALERTIEGEQHLGDESLPPHHPAIALQFHARGRVRMALAQFHDALGDLKLSLQHRVTAFGDGHLLVADSLVALADCQRSLGNYKEAESNYSAALEIRTPVYESDHMKISEVVFGFGLNCQESGRFGEAVSWWEKSLALRTSALGSLLVESHSLIEINRVYLGGVLDQMSRVREGMALASGAGKVLCELLSPTHLEVAHGLYITGRILTSRADFGNAKKLITQSVALMERALGSRSSPLVSKALVALSDNYRQQGHFSDGSEHCVEAQEINKRTIPEDHLMVHLNRFQQAQICRDSGLLKEAEARYQAALDGISRVLGTNNVHFSLALAELGELQRLMGNLDEAEHKIHEAISIHVAVLGGEHRHIAEAKASLAMLLMDRTYRDWEEGHYGDVRHFDSAVAMLREDVLPMAVAVCGEFHPLCAFVRANVGLCLTGIAQMTIEDEEKQYERVMEGQKMIEDAISELRKNALTEGHPWMHRFRSWLGDVK